MLYTVSLKRNFKGQVFAVSETLDTSEASGWMLALHPSLLLKYPLGKKTASYNFFSYELHEALYLSAHIGIVWRPDLQHGIWQQLDNSESSLLNGC